MKWSEIEEREPALGAVARQKLIETRVLLIGTTRRDGTARISGVEPLVLDGTLWLSMMSGSTKAGDLRRDPRVLLHSIVTGPEAAPELKVRGRAREEHDPAVHEHYATEAPATLGWQPVAGRFALFAVDVEEVTYIGYDPETGGQHVARWPTGTEYLRPATTPTSLGPPHPVHRLLTGQS